MDTRIYVMTHKKIAEIPNEIYIPMQVGREGKEDLGYLADNTGIHISEKNSSYCELTGIYWLWKNVDCDIIGICHYRRYFTRNEKLLEKDYIEQVIEEYPIIVPNSSCVKEETVYAQYEKIHNSGKDLDVCRKVIAEKYPEYLAAFDFAMKTILVSVGNMWITRKDIYDRYCKWLFDILFEVEKRIDINGYDAYQRRVMGFLSERLFRVWLMMQPETITEEYVKMIEPADFKNAEKKIELLYKCARLKVAPILQLYQSGTMKGTLAEAFACRDDFGGKIPVWVCWWQGETKMPELIRCCVDSLKRNLPKEKTVLRLITLENCMEYVTFTETIIRKFNEGKISYTHLSDILRAELLFRYGGMWIDATYYVAAPVPEEIFEQKTVYTLRFEKAVWGADITQGRWSGNLWCSVKGKKLFQFLMECLWYYWEMEDELIDYFLIDYVIAMAVEEFPEVKRELEQCEFCGNGVFELQKLMNCKYTQERTEAVREMSVFYKLRRQADYRKENVAGEQTMYGYLVDEWSKVSGGGDRANDC